LLPFLLLSLPSHRFFQYTFAATASTIVSGSVIERAKISAYITYSLYLTAFVYPVVAHWEWSGAGWLSASRAPSVGKILFGSGIVDFAGCGAVHMVGGFSGIVGAYMVGPRLGRYNSDGSINSMPGHNVPFAALGTLVLWFGWYGFNCGSAGRLIGASDVISRVAMSTTLGGAAGGISALAYAILVNGVWDVTMCLNGTLAGLVSITSGCAFFEPWAAVVVGGIGGIIFPAASRLLTKLRVDDPLEAGAMHGGCGMWGLFATGLLAQTKAVNAYYGPLPDGSSRPGGGFYGRGELLAANIVGIVTICGWVVANMLFCFSLLKHFRLLRIPADEEHAGMDESYHGGSAYPGMEPSTVVYDLSTAGGDTFLNGNGGGNGGDARASAAAMDAKAGVLVRGEAVSDVGRV
jgi:Amt family ammonium transporter